MIQLKKEQRKLKNQKKNEYDSLMFVTATERLDDFNKCRKPSILFDGIRKGKIKAAEASN